MSTFVSVGYAKQPFERMLKAVARLAGSLPQPVFVQHGHTPFEFPGFQTTAFMGMEDFEKRMEETDLLILHAGAGSVSHAIRAGKIPVIMPRRAEYGEHVNDHQVEFAHALAETGLTVVAEEPEHFEAAIEEALRRQEGLQRQRCSGVPGSAEPRMVALIRAALGEYAEIVGRRHWKEGAL